MTTAPLADPAAGHVAQPDAAVDAVARQLWRLRYAAPLDPNDLDPSHDQYATELWQAASDRERDVYRARARRVLATLAAAGYPVRPQVAPPATQRVLDDIAVERAAQDAKWGVQDHPDADPVILARLAGNDEWSKPSMVAQRLSEEYGLPTVSRARFVCQAKALRGEVTWVDIQMEEFAEVVEAIVYAIEQGDPDQLREELVQGAAVFAAWIENHDRRQAAGGHQ